MSVIIIIMTGGILPTEKNLTPRVAWLHRILTGFISERRRRDETTQPTEKTAYQPSVRLQNYTRLKGFKEPGIVGSGHMVVSFSLQHR